VKNTGRLPAGFGAFRRNGADPSLARPCEFLLDIRPAENLSVLKTPPSGASHLLPR